MSDGFDWEVRLPDRKKAALGQARPRAVLALSGSEHGSEEYRIPVAVGRSLHAKKKSGEVAPSSRAELLWLLNQVSLDCGRARVEYLVDKRDYSSAELTDKLRQDGYTAEQAVKLVERAVESGMVDDARFAAAFIRSKIYAGWGSAKIERELSRRGVSVEDVPDWPTEFFSADDEAERAYELASRRRLTGKNDYAKIVRFLGSRGFSVGLATSVARRVLDEAED